MRMWHQFVMAIGALTVAAPALASVQISTNPTRNMNCAGGTCTPTAKNADLNATDLANMLNAGDVKIVTAGSAVTITISAPFSWTSSHRLTLDANYNVSFRATVTVAGNGAVTILANDGGTGGDLVFFPGAKMDFWDTGSNLLINGETYTLVNDIASLATAYAANRYATIAFAKDYDAGADGSYLNTGVPSVMDGRFEGLGHTVSNFSASGNDREVGFFSQSLNGLGAIRDLTLGNVNIVGGRSSLTGALGGALNADITNVHSSGHVTAGTDSDIGGLVGYGGRFVNSDSSAAVTCSSKCEAGGLVGFGGQFTRSHASGTVTVGGHSTAGGLVGLLGASSISQSYATGNVISQKLQKSGALGGLAGGAIQNSKISDSYALGSIQNTGLSSLGGLVGWTQDNTVTTSYAVGSVGSGTAPRSRERYAGGFVGFTDYVDSKDYTSDYWDLDSSGLSVGCGGAKPRNHCPAIQPLSDAQLKSGLPAGFNPAIWAHDPAINNGYPYLINNPPQ